MKKCKICEKEHSKGGQCCSKECFSMLRKQTCLKKYGVESPLQSEEIRNRSKQTNLKRYGVEHPSQSEEIKDKMKQTCLDRYGVEHPAQLENIKNKAKQTNLERYGVEHSLQSHIPQEFLTQDWWDQRKDFLEAKELIGNQISYSKVYLKAHQFRPEWEFNNFLISQQHQKVIDFLNNHQIKFTINDRSQIKPYELDIFIPSKNLGIEIDGVYWHSLPEVALNDQIKDKLCEQKGIKLLRFTDLEVTDFFEKCKNQIKEAIY